jgi:hypothetical protein
VNLVVELLSVVVKQIRLSPESIVWRPLMLDVEQSIGALVGVLQKARLNVDVGSTHVTGKVVGASKKVDSRPPGAGVSQDCTLSEGPPPGHGSPMPTAYLRFNSLIG